MGKGFIIFKTEEFAKNLIAIYDQVNANPDDKVIYDPKNILYLKERTLIIRPAISKESALKTMDNKIDPKLLKKMNNGLLTIDEYIVTDINQKRNLNLLKEGLYVSDDNVESADFNEKNRRERHLEEKKIKLSNPNLKLSDTRIHIKSITKLITEHEIKDFVKKVLADCFSKKEMNRKKLLKSVKILKENENDEKSKGLGFIDFLDPKIAAQFMKRVIKKENYATLLNNFKELPIIEYAFIDNRILKKVEDAKKKIKKEKKKSSVVDNLIKKVSNEIEKKNKVQNDQKVLKEKNTLRDQVDDIIKTNKIENAIKLKEQLNTFKYRGLKQRLIKKLQEKFGEDKLNFNTSIKEELKANLAPKLNSKKITKKPRKHEDAEDLKQEKMYKKLKSEIEQKLKSIDN